MKDFIKEVIYLIVIVLLLGALIKCEYQVQENKKLKRERNDD